MDRLKTIGALRALLAAKTPQIAERGYVAKPWYHGTAAELVPSTKPLWMAESPEVASLYTGGGRRAGPGTPAKGGRVYPLVARDSTVATPLDVTKNVARFDNEWLEKLGVKNPTEFRKQVLERAQAQAAAEDGKYSGVTAMGSDLGEVAHFNNSFLSEAFTRDPRLWELLDKPAFRDQLLENLGQDVTLQFTHPSSGLKFDKAGRKRVVENTNPDAQVLFAPSAKDSVRSIFDFKRGGLVQYAERK